MIKKSACLFSKGVNKFRCHGHEGSSLVVRRRWWFRARVSRLSPFHLFAPTCCTITELFGTKLHNCVKSKMRLTLSKTKKIRPLEVRTHAGREVDVHMTKAEYERSLEMLQPVSNSFQLTSVDNISMNKIFEWKRFIEDGLREEERKEDERELRAERMQRRDQEMYENAVCCFVVSF